MLRKKQYLLHHIVMSESIGLAIHPPYLLYCVLTHALGTRNHRSASTPSFQYAFLEVYLSVLFVRVARVGLIDRHCRQRSLQITSRVTMIIG